MSYYDFEEDWSLDEVVELLFEETLVELDGLDADEAEMWLALKGVKDRLGLRLPPPVHTVCGAEFRERARLMRAELANQ